MLLSVAVYIDELQLGATATPSKPAVAFRVPGYPSVLVKRHQRPSDLPDDEMGERVLFSHGKSCLIHWDGPVSSIATGLRLEFYLVDLTEEPVVAHVKKVPARKASTASPKLLPPSTKSWSHRSSDSASSRAVEGCRAGPRSMSSVLLLLLLRAAPERASTAAGHATGLPRPSGILIPDP